MQKDMLNFHIVTSGDRPDLE